MRVSRGCGLLLLLMLLGSAQPTFAQRHLFKFGGGGGFSSFGDSDLDLGRAGTLGGFFGIRASDQLSVEAGFSFGRSNQLYDENNVAIEVFGAVPDFQFETNRYHLDGSFVYHLGRRQPFHPFVLAGGGVVLRTERRTGFEVNEDNAVMETGVDSTSTYHGTFHFGTGVDVYFFSNLSARIEFRWRFPTETSKQTRMYLFGASYFF